MAIEGEGGLKDFWPSFQEGDDLDRVDCSFDGGIAKDVLDTFGIPHDTSVDGGPLDGLDIKSMDAMTALKMSLLDESSRAGRIYEPVTNGEGLVEFVAIGEFDGLRNAEVYYEIQSGTFQEECTGVMVTGRRPLATRKKVEAKQIWEETGKQVKVTPWMAPNCLSEKFSRYATIPFKDPHLSDTAWEDGIDNFYDIKSPWETLLGYVRYVSWKGMEEDQDADVRRSSQSRLSIKVSGEGDTNYNADLGKLQVRPPMPEMTEEEKACFANASSDVNYNDGVKIDTSELDYLRFETIRGYETDKLIGISGVYIIGRQIADCKSIPSDDASANNKNPTDKDATLKISIEESQDKTFLLSEGIHYQIAYSDTQPQQASIVFASNIRNYDPKEFGTNKTFQVDPHCAFYREKNVGDNEGEFTASILPTGPTEAYLVSQVFCIVDIETPSIVIFHPKQDEAERIANDLSYELAPLVSEERPAPVAYSGRSFSGLIDLEEMQKDHDPTTQDQNFDDTEYSQAIRDMDRGGGITLSMPCMEEDEIVRLADTLYDYMNSGNGSVTTYVCSPDSDPQLGGYGYDNDSVVNEISYSYQDSNSYTISVSCGPRLLGDFAQVDGGPSYKMTEEVSARGTITGDKGDNALFNVLVDGYGPVIAINCSPNVLRVHDKVQVTIHNNPVEA